MNSQIEVTSMEIERRILVRRPILFGVPVLYSVLGVLHPTSNPELGDETGLFVGLRVAQLLLIGGLASRLWLLVEGLDGDGAKHPTSLQGV